MKITFKAKIVVYVEGDTITLEDIEEMCRKNRFTMEMIPSWDSSIEPTILMQETS